MIALAAAMLAGVLTLSLGLTLAALLRRRSAALRHAILAAAVIAALVTPIGKLFLPQFPVIHWTESSAVVSSGLTLTSRAIPAPAVDGSAVAARNVPWLVAIAGVWLMGALVIGAGLITGLVRLSRIKNRCTPVAGRWRELADAMALDRRRRRVALLQSTDPSLLVTCGVIRPVIILPEGASTWPDDRCRTVLQHELAHVARHDAAIQIVGEVLRVLQWINPLVWIACRRLRYESEYACDDAVLSGGVEASEYARHLLAVAKHVSARHAVWASAPGIAQPSTLERRIIAMLNHQQNRAPLTRRGWTVIVLAALAVSAPMTAAGVAPADQPVVRSHAADIVLSPALRPSVPAQEPHPVAVRVTQAPSSLDGTIRDQFDGALPGATVTIDNAAAGIHAVIVTDSAGGFTAENIPAGQYELRASLPGFMMLSTLVTVAGARTIERITLPIGAVSESVTVACSASSPGAGFERLASAIGGALFPAVSAQEQGTAVPRVGGNLRVPLKLTDVKPLCPSMVPAGETHVHLTGHIGTDGRISDATVSDAGAPPADLVDAARTAVSEWTYRPTLLDDQPIAVAITVDVVFKRG